MSAPAPSAQHVLHPAGWAAPRGYVDGLSTQGRLVVLAGQVGWNPSTQEFESDDLGAQTRQALANIATLLAEAGAEPKHLVRLAWYITDREAYVAARPEIGRSYREVIGNQYPPMSVLFVTGLVDERAKIEIEATAVVPF